MKKALLLIFLLVVAVTGVMAWQSDGQYQAKLAAATTPEEVASLLLKDLHPEAKMNGGVLSIDYTADAILTAGTAVSGFNVRTAQLVPTLFGRFPKVDSIIIQAHGPFTDIRGNQSIDTMLRISFMRKDAESIKWDNISYDNIPKLGEHYWMHPGIRRQL